MSKQLKPGDTVKIFTEIGDGNGDVTTAWISGTVVSAVTVAPGFKAHGNRPGFVINAPGCAYKDKNLFVADSEVDTVISH